MNELGLRILKSFEGCKLAAYWDATGGVWTIGYGDTGPAVVEGLTWTQEQADAALAARLKGFEAGVRPLVTRDLDDNQISALIDFAYNEGLGNLKSSHLLVRVNVGEFHLACDEFQKWHFSGGVSLPGLITRRRAEAYLFSSDLTNLELLLSQR